MTTPKLRFKEFDGDWLFSKIGETFKVTSGSTPLRSDNRFFENADIAWVKTTDLNNGLIEKTEEKISQIALKETSIKILPKGTVFVAMYGGFNQIGRTGLLVDEAACNQALSAIYPNEKIESYFLLTFLNHKVDEWKNFAASSRKDPNITKSDVLAFPLTYPSKEEQTKIATFLSAVDEKISQLTQKHQLLSQYKQGMMQKLFNQQIRFKADDGSEFGEWKSVFLGDISKPQQWKTISSSELTEIGYPVFGANGYIGFYPKYNHINETIAVTCRGATCGEVTLVKAKSYITGNAMSIDEINENEHSTLYIYYALCFRGFKDVISGSAQPQIVGNAIRKVTFQIPCLEEQTKIANFLSAIDQKIDVASEQLEQAKLWKKGLLQQMFV